MKRRSREPAQIHDVLAQVYPSKAQDDLAAVAVFRAWMKLVPLRVRANARPVRFRRGVITVHASTSVWAHELVYLQEGILESLRGSCPTHRLDRIFVRVGRLPDLAEDRPAKTLAPRRKHGHVSEELARELASIQDDDLRQLLLDTSLLSH